MKRHSISSLTVLMLFTVYAVCISVVLLIGGNAYIRICGRGFDSYNNRVCVQYLTSCIRQADGIEIDEGRGTLILYAGDYVRKVYYHEGYLMELYTRPDANLVPEAGYRIAEVNSFEVEISEGMVTIRGITDEDLVVYVRSDFMVRCTLAEDINECEHYDREKKLCKYTTRCSFQEHDTDMPCKAPKRKERWYEKYYKK